VRWLGKMLGKDILSAGDTATLVNKHLDHWPAALHSALQFVTASSVDFDDFLSTYKSLPLMTKKHCASEWTRAHGAAPMAPVLMEAVPQGQNRDQQQKPRDDRRDRGRDHGRDRSRSPPRNSSNSRGGRSGGSRSQGDRDRRGDIKPTYGMTPKASKRPCRSRDCNGAVHATSRDCPMFGKCFTCHQTGHSAEDGGACHGHGLLRFKLSPWPAAAIKEGQMETSLN
jgi:hypothetical protein